MDDVAQGEDSSSRNGNEIRFCERGADGRVLIRLANGSSFFVSSDFADGNSIRAGLEIGEELWRAIEAEAERLSAYGKGIELLARREHTALELARKLAVRGFSAESTASALASLSKAGYLDDRRFAEAWLRNRLKQRPEGYARLAAGLRRRGVKRDIVVSVLDEMFTEEAFEKALADAAEKYLRRSNTDGLSALKFLTAKGFPYHRAKAHLQKLQLFG